MEKKVANIKIRETGEWKKVKIGFGSKPRVDNKIINKWQSLLDVAANIIQVPSALIMQLKDNTIQVFLKSNTEGNPYHLGEEAELKYGFYCETVIGTQKELIVSDASKSKIWKENNPDVAINMISYLGFPLNWPDGDVFGTVCVLDNKRNNYNNLYKKFLNTVKESLEKDLEIIMKQKVLEKKNNELKHANNVKSKILSLISHDIRTSLGSIKEYFSFLVDDFSELEKDEIYKLIQSLNKSTVVTYEILENLLLWSKNELLQLPVKKEKTNISDFINDIVSKYKLSAELKNISIDKSGIDKNIFLNIDKTMMETAIRNILSNSLKYTNNDGNIRVNLFRDEEKTVLEIEDNGIGMSQNTVDKLFSYNGIKDKKGTQGETSTGIGLLLIREFIEKNNGKIFVESKENVGTKFKVEF